MLNDKLRYDDETYNRFIASLTLKRGEEFIKSRGPGQLYGFFAEELFSQKYPTSILVHISSTDLYSLYDFELVVGEDRTQIDLKTFTKGSRSFTISERESQWIENHATPNKMFYIIYEHDADTKTFTYTSMMNANDVKSCWHNGNLPPNSKFIWVSDAKRYR